jgi:diguanylate cyclase
MSDALRVLLIDDDQLDRMSVVRALKRGTVRYDITEAESATIGLRYAAERKFDVILLDYRMPDMVGIEVLHQLRSGSGPRVAVLMLSRLEDEALAERCLDAGAQDFLLKDEVDHRRLARALRQARQRNQIEEALQASRNELLELSEHDALTGLTNRRGFERALATAAARATRGTDEFALVLLDLDDFKSVNDTDGHDVGDALLVEVTRRLSATIRDSDLLCRLGGDEFVVLVNTFKRKEDVFLLVDRLVQALQPPFVLSTKTHITTASFGVAVYDPAIDNLTDLLRFADMAMYQAKQAGRNQSRAYSPSLQDAARNRNRIKYELLTAIKNDELRVFYQAQIRTCDGSLGGMEALVRWQHPALGLLSPASFIAIAEETGSIVDIGNWVLQTACKQLGVWQRQYPQRCANLALGINVSAVQADTNTLPDILKIALGTFDANSSYLEIEITESALIKDARTMMAMLTALVDQGALLSLDDFGTGYSSLEHLKMFPINVLKIDQSFVSAVGQGKKGEQLLIAIIALAKALEMKVVAEGVETKEQAEFCIRHGCDLLQGYYYSRPIPADEFEAAFLR